MQDETARGITARSDLIARLGKQLVDLDVGLQTSVRVQQTCELIDTATLHELVLALEATLETRKRLRDERFPAGGSTSW